VPVLFFGDLGVQDRTILPDKLSLFLANFVHDVLLSFTLGVVEDIETYSLTFALGFSQNAVFAF
jgi:hypothetical protein